MPSLTPLDSAFLPLLGYKIPPCSPLIAPFSDLNISFVWVKGRKSLWVGGLCGGIGGKRYSKPHIIEEKIGIFGGKESFIFPLFSLEDYVLSISL